MNDQQKQFHLTHITNTNTLKQIVQKAMSTHIEQATRINKGQSNEVYFIDLKDGSFVLRIAKGFDYDIFAIERWAMQEVSRRGVPVAAILAQGLDSSTYKLPSFADAKHAALVIRDTIKFSPLKDDEQRA